MPLPRPAPGTTRWWVVGIVGCLLAVGVIVWWGIVGTVGSVRPEVTGYRVESTPGCSSSTTCTAPRAWRCCAASARSTAAATGSGRVEDAVPASGPTSVHREVRVRTSARAVTGVVDACTRRRGRSLTPFGRPVGRLSSSPPRVWVRTVPQGTIGPGPVAVAPALPSTAGAPPQNQE